MDYRLIALSGKHGVGLYAKVSPEDYERCMQHSWYLDNKGYPVSRINGKTTRIQLFLTNKKYTDHINEDTLDNRRSNLFAGGQGPNQLNRNMKKNGKTSKYPGVSWMKANEKWRAQTKNEGKVKHLGLFKDEVDAAFAYYVAARKRHPLINRPEWNSPEFLERLQLEDSNLPMPI
jgi:hypothetical protein